MSIAVVPRVCDLLRKHSFRFGVFAIGYCCILVSTSERVLAQATTFAGNAQHTSSYAAPAQSLNTFKWIASIDLNNTGDLIHYGAPLVTAANTVLVPVKTGAAGGFQRRTGLGRDPPSTRGSRPLFERRARAAAPARCAGAPEIRRRTGRVPLTISAPGVSTGIPPFSRSSSWRKINVFRSDPFIFV